jgi:hypothetical protein
MGFFFRKSIGFGPLRLNLSKAPSPSPGPSRTDSTRPPVALGPPADSIDVYFCFEPLDLRSLARRSAVLFFAAASDAFLARAERSSGVEFRAAFLPPCLPNSRAIAAIASRMCAGIFTLMVPMVHLMGYGDKDGNILSMGY